jgi:phosphoglycerol transferase
MHIQFFHGKTNIFLFGFILATALFGALTFRNLQLYATVMADEYAYSKFSRLLPLADAIAPSYLYLAIYHTTSLCGDGFYDCARILNALFFVASAPLIYLTARRTCNTGVASIVALLALLGPINSYTAYYMPEALYFFFFWLFTWFILGLDHSSSSKSWCLGGVLSGFSALVKPHALFFLPAIAIYIVSISRKQEGKWLLQAFRNAGSFIAFSFLSKFLIGYFCAGRAGVTLFGPFYESTASSIPFTFQHFLKVLALFIESLTGHTLAICLMFGLPIAIAINISLNAIFSRLQTQSAQKTSFYSLAVLVNLVLIAALYTATTVANAGLEFESIARIHLRYYNFAFPLLLIIAASQLPVESVTGKTRWRAMIALPIGIAILYAVYTRMAPFWPNLIDSPELRGFIRIKYAFYVLGGLSFFTLALWVYSARSGAKVFLFLFMPLAVAYSTHNVNMDIRARLIPDAYDNAGIFTKQYLSDEDRSKLVVVGSDRLRIYRSLFYIDNPHSSQETIPEGSSYNLSSLPTGKEWILVIGDHSLSEKPSFQLPMDGFTLVHITGTNKK